MPSLSVIVLLIRYRPIFAKSRAAMPSVKAGIPREEPFVTTKVWITNADKEQTGCIDLLLIHPYRGTYKATVLIPIIPSLFYTRTFK